MYHAIPADWYPLDLQDPVSSDQLTNEWRLLDALLRMRAPTTQSEIVRMTGLSRSTVAAIVDRLNGAELLEQDQDLLTRRAAPTSGIGRPPTWLALAPESGVVIGVD